MQVSASKIGELGERFRLLRERDTLAHAWLLDFVGDERDLVSLITNVLNAFGERMPVDLTLRELEHRMEMLARVHYICPSTRSRQISVKQIRSLREFAHRSQKADLKIVFIIEAETMNLAAANSLLRVLEEPPSETLFCLTTENTQSLLPTIISRCQRLALLTESKIGIRTILGDGDKAKTLARELSTTAEDYFFGTSKNDNENDNESEQKFAKSMATALRFAASLKACFELLGKSSLEIFEQEVIEYKAYEKKAQAGLQVKKFEDYSQALAQARYAQKREKFLRFLQREFALKWRRLISEGKSTRDLFVIDAIAVALRKNVNEQLVLESCLLKGLI